MGLRQKAKKVVEEEDLEDIEAFTDPQASESAPSEPPALEGLRRDLETAREASGAKDKELTMREKELAKLRVEYEELEREQGALVKDLKAQLKDSEGALKAAGRESERLKSQLGKKEDLDEKDSAIATRLQRVEDREAKAQAQSETIRARLTAYYAQEQGETEREP